MTIARTIIALGVAAAASTTAVAAAEKTDARKAWEHCKTALEAERPEADFELKRHTERGTATYRFRVDAYKGKTREEFSCTAHADRGVMKIELRRA